MSPWYAKAVVLAAAGAIGAIRAIHAHRRPPSAVRSRIGGAYEALALTVAFAGFVLPIVWVFSSWLAFAEFAPQPAPTCAGAGALVLGLWLFHRTHADLGRNWSARLQIVESHELVTTGVYRRIRHPMYLSLLVYGLGQAAVIPNWVAAASCLVGTAVLAGLRIGPEERMMRARFGSEYEAYAARSWRLIPGLW